MTQYNACVIMYKSHSFPGSFLNSVCLSRIWHPRLYDINDVYEYKGGNYRLSNVTYELFDIDWVTEI